MSLTISAADFYVEGPTFLCYYDRDPSNLPIASNSKSRSPRLAVGVADRTEVMVLNILTTTTKQGGSKNNKTKSHAIVDPYQVLQVRRDATPLEIRHAYRRLALFHHPGRSVQATVEERARRLQVFEILAACYETLMDKEARKRCDGLLREMEVQQLTKDMPLGDIRVGGRPVGPRRLIGRVTSLDDDESTQQIMPSLTEASFSTSSSSEDSRTIITSYAHHSGSRTIISQSTKQSDCRRNSGCRHLFGCGVPSLDHTEQLPALANSSTSTSDDGGDIHYTEGETNRLFGGPLQLLFRSRRWKPFSDPFTIFARVFGSKVSLGPIPDKPGEWKPLPAPINQSAGWKGNSERLADGSVMFTKSRVLHDRTLTRTEVVRVDPRTGQKHSYVTVTSEALSMEEPDADEITEVGCVRLDFCVHFTECESEPRSDDDWFTCGTCWLPDCL